MVVDAHAPMKRNKYEVKMAHPEKTCEGGIERGSDGAQCFALSSATTHSMLLSSRALALARKRDVVCTDKVVV